MKRTVTVLFFFLMMCCSSAFATLTVRIECDEELNTLWSLLYGSETTSFTTDDATASWNLSFDADPYIESSVSLTNKTSSAKTYTFIFTVDIDEAIMPDSLYSGSVSGSLEAGPWGGHLSTVSNTPLYSGMIDDAEVLSFYPHLSSWTGNATFTDMSPGPSSYEKTVYNTISIRHRFKLWAGDTVTLNGYFEVVPEPATIALLTLGGLAMLLRRNRFSANAKSG